MHFSKYRLRIADFERPDLLGTAYKYLIKMFADSAGKKGGEFNTTSEVVKLLVVLLKPEAGMCFDAEYLLRSSLSKTHKFSQQVSQASLLGWADVSSR